MAVLTTDFVNGLDASALGGVVTGANLNSLIASGYVAADKGLVVLTTDSGTPVPPDPASQAKWKRYIWIRQTLTQVIAYVWNDVAVPNGAYLKWQSITVASIASDSILTAMILNDAVTNDKILSVSYAKVTGLQTYILNTLSAAACTGDMDGSTFASMAIKTNGITSSKLLSSAGTDANRAVTTDHIKDANVTVAKINPHTSNSYILATVAGAVTWIPYATAASDVVKVYRVSDIAFPTFAVAPKGLIGAALTHGLGGKPDGITLNWKAVDTTYGYAVGDLVPITTFFDATNSSETVVCFPEIIDTTTIRLIKKDVGASGIRIIDYDGDPSDIAEDTFAAKFTIDVKAWRFAI